MARFGHSPVVPQHTPSPAGALFRALIETSSDVVSVVGADGLIRYVSPSMERVLGYRPEEQQGQPVWALVHPDDLEDVRRVFAGPEAASGAVQRTCHRARHKDGSWRVLESVGTQRFDDPAVGGVIVNSRDVTGRAHAEAALQASGETLRALIEAAPEAVIAIDTRGDVTIWNPAAEQIFGWAAAEVLGKPIPIVPEDARQEYLGLREQVMVRGEALSGVQVVRRRKDGSLLPISLSMAPMREAHGRISGAVSLSADVSEQQRATAALRESQQLFRTVVDTLGEGVVITDLEDRILYTNARNHEITGFAPEELFLKKSSEVLLPPQERGTFEQRIQARTEGRASRYEMQQLRKDGSTIWVEVHGSPLRDSHDQIIGTIGAVTDVTERKAAEEANRRLAAIVESSSDAIVSQALDGTVLSWNAAAERIYGYTAAEMLGQPISVLLPPELDGEEASTVFLLSRGERIESRETVRLRKDGRRIHVSQTLSPIRDDQGEITSASIIARDISEAKRVEAQLRASNERYYLAVRATKDIIWDCDLRTGRIEWGEAIYTTFGYPRDRVEPELSWWAERIHPGDLDAVTASLDGFLAGGAEAWSHEYRFRRGDGSYASVLDRRYAIRDLAGAVVRMIGSMVDVTTQRETEAALRRAKEAAEAANRSKSEFLSGMSHELRTPLNSVIGFTNVLRKNKAGNLREQDLAYLERIRANGMHLLGLINDILDLSKIEAGKMKVDRAPVMLDALIRETLEELQGSVPRGVELGLDAPDGLAMLETDARKLKQILINLVGNALKFTEAGSVTAHVVAEPTTLRPVRIDIVDTGVGISEHRLQTIFEAFEQGEGGTARRFGGTGLGLAICSSLAHLLGYRVLAQSEVGRGSTFSVLLGEPAAAVPAEIPATHHALDDLIPGAESGEFADRLVLVIDDDPDARFVLSEALAEHGCEILTAASAAHGIELARQIRPDLITLDLVMSDGMSGWEALRILKADRELCDIPVVVISVLAEEARGSLIGAVDLMRKPPDRAELRNVLRRNLGDRPGRVLVVDDEEDARLRIASCILQEGVELRTAGSGREALNVLESFSPDLIFLDLHMPEMDGTQLLAHLRQRRPDLHPAVVVVTGETLGPEEADRLRRQVASVIPKSSGLEVALRREMRQVWKRRA